MLLFRPKPAGRPAPPPTDRSHDEAASMMHSRKHARPCHGRWDHLEPRFVLNGANLTIIGSSPADGQVVTQAPSSVTVTFDRPVDPNSLGFSDLLVDQVGPNGTLTPVYDPNIGDAGESLDP